MIPDKKIELEPRGEKDPKFNIHNKTDKKILLTVIISVSVMIVIIVALFIIYYKFFNV